MVLVQKIFIKNVMTPQIHLQLFNRRLGKYLVDTHQLLGPHQLISNSFKTLVHLFFLSQGKNYFTPKTMSANLHIINKKVQHFALILVPLNTSTYSSQFRPLDADERAQIVHMLLFQFLCYPWLGRTARQFILS